MENEPLIEEEETRSFCQRLKQRLSYITIEPALFMMVFAYGISLTVTPTLLLDRCCRVDYGFKKDVCDHIQDHAKELSACQIWSNKISVYKMVCQSIPSAFIAFFSGAWTDKYGRKLGLLVPLFFTTLEYILFLIFSINIELSDPWYILSAVTGLGGGMPLFLASTFSYITDISTVEERNLRVSLLDGTLFVGLPLGSLISGVLLSKINYVGIFSLTVTCMASAFVYLVVRIDESNRASYMEYNELATTTTQISIFGGVKETLHSVFRKRPERNAVVLLVIAMFFYTTTYGVNVYYYTIVMYKWTQETYSYFFAVTIVADGLFSYVLFPSIMKFFNASDPTLGIFGGISALTRSIILVFSFNQNIFILGYAAGIFGAYTSVVLRSTVSKISPKANIGKIFAVVGGVEALVPIMSSTIFTYVYDQTIDTFPGWIFVCLSGVNGAIILLLLGVHYIFSKESNQRWLMEFYGT